MATPKTITPKKKVNTRPKKVDASVIEIPTNSWGGATREEIESRGAYPQTVVKVEEAARMVADGVGRQDIINHLRDKYDMSLETARKYYISACHYLIPEDDKFKKALIKQNFQRLEKIVDDSLKSNDRKMAKEAIAEMNKMLGLGGNSVRITQDAENKTNEITINFGG